MHRTKWFRSGQQTDNRLSPALAAAIGKPDFKLEVSQDKKNTTLYVQDPLTALFKDGSQLNLRDVYADKLMYKVTYRRNKSTGKVGDRRTDGQTAFCKTEKKNVFPFAENEKLQDQRDQPDRPGRRQELLLLRPGLHSQPQHWQAAGGAEQHPVLR